MALQSSIRSARRTRLVSAFLTLALCLSVSILQAQDNSSVMMLSNGLDQQAAVQSLPHGDGVVQPVEQSLAAAIINDVTGFDEIVSEYAQSSPENANWVDQIEQNIQQYTQDMASASTLDIRAQIISDAVDQYGAELDAIQPTTSVDIRAQIISDAVAQYGVDVEALQAQMPGDPRAEAISGAVEQYSRYVDELQAQTPRDPRAEAISGAVEQYSRYVEQLNGSPLTPDDQQRVENAIQDASSSYIDQSDIQHKNIAKRRVNRLIQIEVASQMLPINGYWRVRPFEMQTSGTCRQLSGDNGGMAPIDVENDPGQPLCGYDNPTGLPFIEWEGDEHPYLPGTGSIYSRAPESFTSVVTDSNGATTGSVRTTYTTEYRVVAPDRIQVHLVIQEQGGCTQTADYILELVTADESVCPEIVIVSTPVEIPVSTEVAATPQPGTPAPTEAPVEDVPQVMRGLYHVNSQEYLDQTECTETNTPPVFEDVNIEPQADGSLLLDYGSGTQILYDNGDNSFLYDTGINVDIQYNIYLNLHPEGLGYLAWSMKSSDNQICYATMDIGIPGAVLPTPTPAPVEETETDAVLPVPGTYQVIWESIPGLECDPTLEELLPNFEQATVSQTTEGYTIDAGESSYPLTDVAGFYSYTSFSEDGSSELIMLMEVQDSGNMLLNYTNFSADGAYCMQQLTFTP